LNHPRLQRGKGGRGGCVCRAKKTNPGRKRSFRHKLPMPAGGKSGVKVFFWISVSEGLKSQRGPDRWGQTRPSRESRLQPGSSQQRRPERGDGSGGKRSIFYVLTIGDMTGGQKEGVSDFVLDRTMCGGARVRGGGGFQETIIARRHVRV